MSLARRLVVLGVVSAAAVGVLAAVAAVGLAQLDQKLTAALGEYRTLRSAYEQGVTLVRVRERLRLQPDRAEAALAIGGMLAMLDAGPTRSADPALRAALHDALKVLDDSTAEPDAAGQPINRALNVVAARAGEARQAIARLQREAEADQRRALRRIAVVAVAMLVLLTAGGAWQYRRIIGPVRQLTASTRRLAGGDLTDRVDTAMDRELAELARSFNAMVEQLAAVQAGLEEQVRTRSAALVQAERLAAVGMLAAGVAHEVNNPLGVIAGEAELALREGDAPADRTRRLEAIRDEAFRCKQVTERLLALARPTSGARGPVDLGRLACEVVAVLQGEAHRRDVTLEVEPAGASVEVIGSAQELRQVLVNLVLNALASAPPTDGRVVVAASGEAGMARITVRDNGAGMDAATVAQLFEPFFTQREGDATPGHGLGLWVSQMLVAQHGGTLRADSDGPGRGSRFTVELPAGKAEAAR